MSQESQPGQVTHEVTVSLREWAETMAGFGRGFSRSTLARLRYKEPGLRDRRVLGRDGKVYPATRSNDYVRDRAAVVLWLRGQGLSTRAIADRLTELGHPTSQSTVSRTLREWEIAPSPANKRRR